MLVDVHTHLTHIKFSEDRDQVIERAITEGLGAIVCNGLEPISNREILTMAAAFPVVKAALGIYPLDAVNHLLPVDFPHRIGRFDVREEIQFIETCAKQKKMVAVGECGLDGFWVGPETFPEQILVFEALVDIAMRYEIPVIVHSRKLEQKTFEVLENLGAKNVDFHCYGGRSKFALEKAEKNGWYFSIPSNARRTESFGKLLRELPVQLILTETDAPYMSLHKGERSEPKDVADTVNYLAELRNISTQEATEQIWNNYLALFKPIEGV
jgi:TatD DNase family protein